MKVYALALLDWIPSVQVVVIEIAALNTLMWLRISLSQLLTKLPKIEYCSQCTRIRQKHHHRITTISSLNSDAYRSV